MVNQSQAENKEPVQTKKTYTWIKRAEAKREEEEAEMARQATQETKNSHKDTEVFRKVAEEAAANFIQNWAGDSPPMATTRVNCNTTWAASTSTTTSSAMSVATATCSNGATVFKQLPE